MKSLSTEQDLILSLHFTLHNSSDSYQQINISQSEEKDLLNYISSNTKWIYVISPEDLETWHNKYLNTSIILNHDDTLYIQDLTI